MGTRKVDPDLVLCGLSARGRSEALGLLADRALRFGYVRPSFKEAVIEREEKYPTALPVENEKTDIAVAIPHASPDHVLRPSVGVATLKNPVKFVVMGSEGDEIDVRMILMLFVPDGKKQIDVLKKIMAVIQNQKLLRRVYDCGDPARIAGIFNRVL